MRGLYLNSPHQLWTSSSLSTPALSFDIVDAAHWVSFLPDARSEFCVSINLWVSNGMLPYRMRPISEGAAVSAVAEAALIA